MKKLLLLLITCFCLISAQAAYLRDIPVTVTQPDGTTLECFASGDEYFNYLHDANGYTIMQHPETGYYVYADKRDGKLVATDIIAGRQDPASAGLKPYALISPEEWIARRQAWRAMEEHPKKGDRDPNHGTLNNIAIFIRFSDDAELTNSFTAIDNMFNDVTEGAVSLRSYFREASYGNIEIPTTFYPGHNGNTVISYQDTYPRSYFQPYNAATNPNGYQESERADREFALLQRAVNYINANYPIPTSLNIDYDNDGYVDNVCFIVKGNVGGWNDLLWPHKWWLYYYDAYINGKRVGTFNFQLADGVQYFTASTMCHEMNHSLSAPDLYHYYNGTSLHPVGCWDLMEYNSTPPQHCGAYMKMKYGHWIDEIPEITQPGTYTLNPISSETPTNIAYKIASSNPYQYYVLEYRNNSFLYESALPGSGLLIYRIDTRFDGNADYDPSSGVYDEVYLFRPGGTTTSDGNYYNAYFSYNSGRTEFSASTNPYPYFTGGTIDNDFRIYDISAAGNTISFSYGGASTTCQPPTNVTATVNDNVVNLSWTAAANAQSYNIYRNGALLGNTSGTSYTDSSVSLGVYSYYLKSIDTSGLQSSASETVSVSVMPSGYTFIGDGGTAHNDYLPCYSYYKYSLSEQIYTAAELGSAGTINGISFFNAGDTKTRTLEFYLKNTTKNTFSANSDWVAVSASDKVYSGSVTLNANEWTTITFDTPFVYNGTSNILLVTDDNTGSWSDEPNLSCRVFNASNQSMRAYNDNTNYDPCNPSGYTGTMLSVKNQIYLQKDSSGAGLQVYANYYPDASDPYSQYVKVSWVENKGERNIFNVYRANCDGSGQVLLANNITGSQYIDAVWSDLAQGNYKYGVSIVDVKGNSGEIQWDNSSVTLNHAAIDPTAHLKPVVYNRDPDDPSIEYYDNGWLYYDDGVYAISIGISSGATIWWAAMFPASDLTPHAGSNLTKVSFYENSYNIDPVTVSVYLGGDTAPQTLVSTTTYNPVGGNGFNEISLSTPVAIDGTQNLWLVFSEFGTYPANACADSGVPNDRWISLDGETWNDVTSFDIEYMWMIRGYLEGGSSGGTLTWSNCIEKPSAPVVTYQITATANPAAGGNVTGSNTYEEGATCTLTATANTGYSFVNWTKNGTQVSTNSTYSFTVTQSANYVANFTLNTYVVTVMADPASGGTVTGGNSYTHGATATVTVTPNQYYVLDNWTLNGTVVSEETSYSFVVTQNCNLVAHLINTEGITEDAASSLTLYPNPAHDNINLSGAAMQTVMVYNAMGQLVIAKEYDNVENVELSLSSLNPGIYTVTVRMTDGSIAKKMVIKGWE